jgi:hypothetical protein
MSNAIRLGWANGLGAYAPTRPVVTRWWTTAIRVVSLARWRTNDHPSHADRATRYAFLERAVMAREMDRL